MNTTNNILTTQELLSTINELSFEGQKEFRKLLNEQIRSHIDYSAPTKKAHLEYKKGVINKVLDKVLGFNAAFKTLKKLVKDEEVILSNCSVKTLTQSQIDFALTSLPKCKHFMTETLRNQTSFTPRDILNTIVKVGEMKPTTYAKRVLTYS